MEQQLIDILEKAKSPDDIDDVSKAMIMSRVTNTLTQVRELTNQYIEGIRAIQKEHDMELNLGGLAIVLNVIDDVADKVAKGPTQMCVLGPRNKVLKSVMQLVEKV